MVGVGAHAVTDELGQNRRTPPHGKIKALQNEDSGSFPDDETVPLGVPGAGGVRGIIVAGREGLHRRNPPDTHRRDGRLGTTTNHYIRFVACDDAKRVPHRVRARRTGRCDGGIRTLGAGPDLHLARSQIHDTSRDKEGRDPARPTLQQRAVLPFDNVELADAAANMDPHSLGDGRGNRKP